VKAVHSVLMALGLVALSGCHSNHAVAQAPVVHEAFDGGRAFGYLKAQCDFGPRVPNTPAHEKCKDYIIKTIQPYCDKVDTQTFQWVDNHRHVTLNLTNIIGVINPTAPTKVMLFTHWDTRPTADQELDAAAKKQPIPGADDGASGTAIEMELAKTFHDKRPNVCIELLFVDGEDWGPDDAEMYLGAIHFAKNPGAYKPEYAILLDMVGDKNLQIHREVTSETAHPEIDDKVWQAAKDLGYSAQFPDDTKYTMTDDHDAFLNEKIPAIDLIDFDFPYWHTLADTPDKCSPQALKIVGETMARVVYSGH
jgi:glutaminyl-peptide cyclotransferase